MKHKHIYMPNTKLGNCVYLAPDKEEPYAKGLFRCKCGVEFTTRYNLIISRKTKSCGCLKIEKLRARTGKVIKPITPELEAAIIADVKLNELSMRNIVEKHGVSVGRVGKIKNKYYANS